MKTKDRVKKVAHEAGISMKTQVLTSISGNVIENTGSYLEERAHDAPNEWLPAHQRHNVLKLTTLPACQAEPSPRRTPLRPESPHVAHKMPAPLLRNRLGSYFRVFASIFSKSFMSLLVLRM